MPASDDEADDGYKREGVARNEQGDHGADDAERNDGEDDERVLFGVLNSSNRMPRKPKMVITMMVPSPPKLSRAALHFAGGQENFSRQAECLHASSTRPVTSGGVVAFLRVTGDGDVAVLVVVFDGGHGAFELYRCELTERHQRSGERGDVQFIQHGKIGCLSRPSVALMV